MESSFVGNWKSKLLRKGISLPEGYSLHILQVQQGKRKIDVEGEHNWEEKYILLEIPTGATEGEVFSVMSHELGHYQARYMGRTSSMVSIPSLPIEFVMDSTNEIVATIEGLPYAKTYGVVPDYMKYFVSPLSQYGSSILKKYRESVPQKLHEDLARVIIEMKNKIP